MNKYIACLLLASLLLATPAMAATYSCFGTVTGLSITPGGVVVVSGFGGLIDGDLCQLGATAPNGYTADACKAAYAQLLVALNAGTQLRMDFNDNLTCTTQPSWGWLMGLYFGPGTI